MAAKLALEQDFKGIDAEIKAELEDAAEFALSSSLETEETALDHVYFNPAVD
jgi:TPP-dependent pyruvate/acetoin dehydrogenase alpha subunit